MKNLTTNVHVPIRLGSDLIVKEGSYCNFILYTTNNLLMDVPNLREEVPLIPFIFKSIKPKEDGRHIIRYGYPTCMVKTDDERGDPNPPFLDFVFNVFEGRYIDESWSINSADNPFHRGGSCDSTAIVYNIDTIENNLGIYPLLYISNFY